MEEERQVRVRFHTELSAELRVVDTPFSVPSNLSRYGLSEVINALLHLEHPVPFDFLIDGELLRTSLEQFLLTRKLSAEITVAVEYIRAVVPPEPQETHLHDEWVSAVDGSHPSFIFSGSYDSFIRIWSAEGRCLHVLEGHKDAITSLATDYLTAAFKNEDVKLLSASKDRTVRIWQLAVGDPNKDDSEISIKRPVKILKGHKSSVQSIAVKPSGDEVCSGSWDCTLRLWKIAETVDMDEDIAIASKKRKLDDLERSAEGQEVEIECDSTLEGHTQCVSAVAWPENGVIYSSSWDHSVRSWDVETSINMTTLTCGKALNCLSIGGHNSALVAAGGADPILRIWDPRRPDTVAPVFQLTSHKSWISACKWHRRSEHHIISASYDGSVKLWDIRSKIPLHTLERHTDKVLSVDWWREASIISGGDDCQLQIFSKVQIY